ncbi:hypothetical protein AAC387_Pa09g0570 [Persea americana]
MVENGKPLDDSKEFVLRSSPRSDQNRDFFDPVSRTRSGKIRISPSAYSVSVSTDLSNKRMKASSVSEEISMEKKEGSGTEAPIVVDDGDGGVSEKILHLSPNLNPPTRRITRSFLKALQEPSSIETRKLPLTIEHLLATGLLEGLPVKYVYGGNKDGLQGTIKGNGILCSCSSCEGSKVVGAFEFMQHAGSSSKSAAKYIRFENGKNFCEILNACKRAPLDILESTIKSAICLSSLKEDSARQNCKEALQLSGAGELELVCNKSPQTDQSQGAADTGTDETPATVAINGRLSKPCLKVNSSYSPSKQFSFERKHRHGRVTKKDLRLHKLVFMDDVLPDGTELAYYVRGQRLLEGYKKGNLIFCRCCNTEVSPSQFEAHAGFASRRKPYLNIYISNGVSLHELSVSLSKRKFSTSDSDDLCAICADGGDLVLCDVCPRAFHKECVGLLSVPTGDWYCKYCKAMFEREKHVAYNANAYAAGRVLGVDPVEQISKRCIRIVKMSEPDVSACVLCRCHHFSKSTFGPRTVLLCDQCEKEYHVGCLKDHKMGDLKELPEGKWFCCEDCNKIHTALQKLIVCGSEALPYSLLNGIRQKHGGNNLSNSFDLDVRWRLLSGNTTCSDSSLLLSQAVAIFHNCFDPIVDSDTGKDLIPSMIYGSKRAQEYAGMYCAVLIVNSSVVSAGILRIFGLEVAELPLVATSSENQGKGYFHSLFSCIERLLGFLNVKNLLLPAADEAQSIWTKKFGFTKIDEEELCRYTKDYSHMMTFTGTSMLHKLVPKCLVVNKPTMGN